MQRLKHTNEVMFDRLFVRPRPNNRLQGFLRAGSRVMQCALGRAGMGSVKREGDGKTPIGTFALLSTHVRRGGGFENRGMLPTGLINPDHGWCDEVGNRNYNQPVRLPYHASHERLLRDDHLYDVFIVMDHNVTQRLSRGGSAIFFHLAHEDYRPTEGCVAISRADMHWLLPRIGCNTKMVVGG